MTNGEIYISKGIYQHSQIGNFVSVKNYIFIRKQGKKCLLLRFANDSDYTVTSMAYTIVQINSVGTVIDHTKVECGDLSFVPGTTYATTVCTEVDEYCTDFKILFSYVRSGNYKYQVRNGKVTAYFDKIDTSTSAGTGAEYYGNDFGSESNKKSDSTFLVKPRSSGHPKLAAFFASIAVVCMIGVSVAGVFFSIFASEEPPETYEETE